MWLWAGPPVYVHPLTHAGLRADQSLKSLGAFRSPLDFLSIMNGRGVPHFLLDFESLEQSNLRGGEHFHPTVDISLRCPSRFHLRYNASPGLYDIPADSVSGTSVDD